ncbi:glycosyltransferase family 2 protein [Magnetovibrio sp.]|uniref:glycosyltransferase family 2 protein n=1 Tax=Magnetovibrio sp. TaxID=2024836 RepID=UPI002F92D985
MTSVEGGAEEAWARTTTIIVTHHSGAVIGPCLDSVARATRIIVIDNESADDTLDIVRQRMPRAEIIENPVGVGYGNAANQGLALVQTEFALLMNPDAEFVDEALASLVAEADVNADAGLLSPLLVGTDGDFDRAWNGPLFQRDLMPGNRKSEPKPEGSFCTWVVSGAVNLVRMSALKSVGFFDDAIFLYHEDDDICLRLMAAGFKVLVVPDAVAHHIGGGSIGSGRDRLWEKFYNLSWSRLYFEAKHHSPAAARVLGWRQVLRFGLKALLLFRPQKAYRDAARFCGALAYMRGRPASKTTTRARPEGTV